MTVTYQHLARDFEIEVLPTGEVKIYHKGYVGVVRATNDIWSAAYISVISREGGGDKFEDTESYVVSSNIEQGIVDRTCEMIIDLVDERREADLLIGSRQSSLRNLVERLGRAGHD